MLPQHKREPVGFGNDCEVRYGLDCNVYFTSLNIDSIFLFFFRQFDGSLCMSEQKNQSGVFRIQNHDFTEEQGRIL